MYRCTMSEQSGPCRQVLMLSSMCSGCGLAVATITVLQLPPRESLSIMVIMALRYGMCGRFIPMVRVANPQRAKCLVRGLERHNVGVY